MENNDNIYANVTATPVNPQSVYSQTVNTANTEAQNNGQANYYQQPVYQQPMYQQIPQPQKPAGIQCPGKEITGMIFGINALVWGILSLIVCWIPIYSLILGTMYGVFAIAFAIVAKTLANKVFAQATIITNKIRNGNKLATAGLVLGIIGLVLSIIIGVLWISLFTSGSSNSFVNEFSREFGKHPQGFYY